jgi:hypothetical protein
MPLATLGGVILGGLTFTTDPSTYEPLNWQKRFSTQMAIGGRVTIQDFGTFMKDNTLRLASGDRNFLEDSAVIELHTKYRALGLTYTLTDWLSNEFTVFIKSFVPVPFKKGPGTSLYTYNLELHVTTIVKLWGAVYSGS